MLFAYLERADVGERQVGTAKHGGGALHSFSSDSFLKAFASGRAIGTRQPGGMQVKPSG